MKEITKEHLKKCHGLTVKELLAFIKKYDVPESAIVLIQRIEDHYFEKNSWSVYTKEGEHSYYLRRHNEKIDSGEFDDIEQYPDITTTQKTKFTEEEINEAKEQYFTAHSPVLYKDDVNDFLFIDSHY